MGWLSRLLGTPAPAPAVPESTPPRPSAAAAVAAPGSPAPQGFDLASAFVAWLLPPSMPAGPAGTDLTPVWQALDAVLALPELPAELLPRASAVVPQLMRMMRQGEQPLPVLAEQVSKDVPLTAEVLRLAGSVLYRARGPVTDLRDAIGAIGVSGLNAAIARVVLKPIFQAGAGSLSAHVAAPLWNHAELQAQHAALEARDAGLPLFDGYLAGLLHDSGWTVLCRVLDRDGLALPGPALDAAAAAALDARAHRLFALAARGWVITPGFNDFAAEAATRPLELCDQPLAAALRAARVATMTGLTAPG